MVNLQYPDLNLNNWHAGNDGQQLPALTVDGVQFAILRWDLSAYAGKTWRRGCARADDMFGAGRE